MRVPHILKKMATLESNEARSEWFSYTIHVECFEVEEATFATTRLLFNYVMDILVWSMFVGLLRQFGTFVFFF